MEVVILCGGKGTRMRDVATDVPKPMVLIGDQPILWHIMKGFATHGFTRFVLCLGYKSWVIKSYFLNYCMAKNDITVGLDSPNTVQSHGAESIEDWQVTLAETGLETMTAYRIRCIEKYISGEDFLVTYGDGVSDVNISELVDFHLAHKKIGTVTAVRPPGRFGELNVSNQQVVQFVEKPQVSQGRINGGFFVFNRRIFSRLRNDQSVALEGEPLSRLARDKELMAYEHDGFWQPIDNSRDYECVNEMWKSGQAPWRTWETPSKFRMVG
jgi:glucose-1-phosphate cytidylyltransferase